MRVLRKYTLSIVGILVIVGTIGSGPFVLGLFYCSVTGADCGFFGTLWRGVFVGLVLCAGMGIIYGAMWLAAGALLFVQQEMQRSRFHWFLRGCLSVLSVLAVLFAFAASCDYLKSLSE